MLGPHSQNASESQRVVPSVRTRIASTEILFTILDLPVLVFPALTAYGFSLGLLFVLALFGIYGNAIATALGVDRLSPAAWSTFSKLAYLPAACALSSWSSWEVLNVNCGNALFIPFIITFLLALHFSAFAAECWSQRLLGPAVRFLVMTGALYVIPHVVLIYTHGA